MDDMFRLDMMHVRLSLEAEERERNSEMGTRRLYVVRDRKSVV